MAIVFSLPWALLMWAYVFYIHFSRIIGFKLIMLNRMMLFSIELLISCFNHTNLDFRLPVGVMATFVAAPITWCVWNSWSARLDVEI